MNIWTDWPNEATFGDDLEALLEAVQFRAINADVEQYRHYSRLFERLQSVRSEYRQTVRLNEGETVTVTTVGQDGHLALSPCPDCGHIGPHDSICAAAADWENASWADDLP